MPGGHAPSRELEASRKAIEERGVEPDPDDATVAVVDASGVPISRLTPPNPTNDLVFLHFHGGAYHQGSPRAFANQVARIAKATGVADTYSVAYGLAPEKPSPAGLEDAVTAFRWLVDSVPADHVVLWGDSAGGGLVAALLLRLRQLRLPRPAGAVLFSAWADLRVASESYEKNSATDELFSLERAREAAGEYLDGHDPHDPLVSPVLGDWTGQPPLLVFVSDIEVLRDDSVHLAKAALDAGVAVRLEKFSNAQHIWPILSYPESDDSVRAVQIMSDFLNTMRAPTR